MKVKVSDIGPDGLSFHEEAIINPKTPKSSKKKPSWFEEAIHQTLTDVLPDNGEASMDVHFDRTGHNILMTGFLTVQTEPLCARCLEHFQRLVALQMNINMAPAQADEEGHADEEEMDADDENFIFYSNEEVDMADVVREQLELEKPIRYLCQEDCRGLCTVCGANLNLKPCRCTPVAKTQPFVALKDLLKN